MVDAAGHLDRSISDGLHRHRSALAEGSVRGDQDPAARVRQSRGDRVGPEAAEDRHPDRAQLRARHHRRDRLDRHRQEDPDGVAVGHAETRGAPVRRRRSVRGAPDRSRCGPRRPPPPTRRRGRHRACAPPTGRRTAGRRWCCRRRTTSPIRARGTGRRPGRRASRTRDRGRARRRPRTTRDRRWIGAPGRRSASMPCARISLVTFAASICSSVGRQTSFCDAAHRSRPVSSRPISIRRISFVPAPIV